MSRHPNSAYTPQAFGLSHRRTVTPQYSTARGYATALKNGATDSAQPKSKIPSKKAAPKASPGKVSSSGLKEVMRKQQMEAHKQETAKGQEAVARDEDATAHQEYMNRVTKQAPGLDLWTQADMDILDLAIPVRNRAPWGFRNIRWLWDNWQEHSKNTMAMLQITNGGAFPKLYADPQYPYGEGKDAPLSSAPEEFKLYKPSHISQALNYYSTAPGAWGAGIPGLSLSLYKQMCKAIAENDKQTLNKVTSSQQQAHALKSLENRAPDIIYKWKLVKENSPTRIVSLRGGPAYSARIDAGLNRTIIQALIRFDTIQSFEVYNKRTKQQISEPASKRVVEYFVVEKKGWSTMPWVIRQRIFDKSLISEPTEGKPRSLLSYIKFW